MKWEGGRTVNTERKHHQNLEDSQERMFSTTQKSRLLKATKDNRPNVNNRNIYDAVSAGTGQILLIVLDLLNLFCLLTEPLLSQRALKLVLTFIEGIFELLEGLRERERRFIFLHQFIQVYPWQQIWKWEEKIKKKKKRRHFRVASVKKKARVEMQLNLNNIQRKHVSFTNATQWVSKCV